jgi:ABC-2 type transport system ATP-binding protein
MAQSALKFQDAVVASVIKEIEELVQEDYITDAIEKLFDFIRDFTGQSDQNRDLMREALQISARHARCQKARRHRLPAPEDMQVIINDLMNEVDKVAKIAALPVEPPPPVPKAPAASTPPVATVYSAPVASVAEKLADDPKIADFGATNLKRIYIASRQAEAPADASLVAKVDRLELHYRRGNFKLGPVSFDLRAGEITGVVGMNASGKTSMLRCLLGEIKPSAGAISYPAIERDTRDWFNIRGALGYVAQLPERWSGRLRTNLNYTASAFGLTGRANDDLVDWYVHRYGLDAHQDADWDQISGGYKIRFELVRSLLTRPRLLVLDEPLAYLDIVTQQTFLLDLRSIATSIERPIPIIVTSQHLHEIEAVADRMVILDEGTCLYSGPIGKMPASLEFTMVEAEIAAPKSKILSVLRTAGLVDIERTTLGWILIFRKQEPGVVQKALLEGFGGSLSYYRDITHSTRSLLRNNRDDLEQGQSKA